MVGFKDTGNSKVVQKVEIGMAVGDSLLRRDYLGYGLDF